MPWFTPRLVAFALSPLRFEDFLRCSLTAVTMSPPFRAHGSLLGLFIHLFPWSSPMRNRLCPAPPVPVGAAAILQASWPPVAFPMGHMPHHPRLHDTPTNKLAVLFNIDGAPDPVPLARFDLPSNIARYQLRCCCSRRTTHTRFLQPPLRKSSSTPVIRLFPFLSVWKIFVLEKPK